MDQAVEELAAITGQRPIVRKARKSIAQFKLRVGMQIGCAVTLRRDRMYEFLDRLVNIALPRVRDFRGLSPKGFDGRGQLHDGDPGPLDLPGDRLHQGRDPQGHERHRGDHRGDRRPGPASCLQELGFPFAKG